MTTIIERLASAVNGWGITWGTEETRWVATDADAKDLFDLLEVHGLTVMDRAEVEAAERHLRAIQAELRSRAGVDV
jgi:hypothetical protein